MIRGMHAMFYSSHAEALRTFLRDKLGLAGTDVGGGWLIFDAPEADLGVHPTEGNNPASGTAEISFYCNDIHQTVNELRTRGVEFTQEVEDHGYGLVTFFKVPGDFKVQLYQPQYTKQNSMELTKSQKRHLRDLAAMGHDRELSAALKQLEGHFARWQAGEITALDLNELVHQHHNGISREIYNRYDQSNPLFPVASAIVQHFLTWDEVREDCKPLLKGMVEFFSSQIQDANEA